MTRLVTIDLDAYLELPPTVLKATLGLLRFANADGECWPGQRHIAVTTRLAPGTLSRALKQGQACKVIHVDHRGGRQSDRYVIGKALRPYGCRPRECSNFGTQDRSTFDTKERSLRNPPIPYSDSSLPEKRGDSNNQEGFSRRCAPLAATPAPLPPKALAEAAAARAAAEKRAKRQNLIKTLRRWSQHSERCAEDDRLPQLELLTRVEGALNHWDTLAPEDQRWFDRLAVKARRHPLPPQFVQMIRDAERGAQDRHYRPRTDCNDRVRAQHEGFIRQRDHVGLDPIAADGGWCPPRAGSVLDACIAAFRERSVA